MLSQKIIRKKRIYSICEKSAEINPNDVFKKVILAESNENRMIPDEVCIVCCGKVNDEEMLFRSSDGRCYFSVKDGWGEESGILYGISEGLYFDFQHPTTDQTILSERLTGYYRSYSGAMAFQGKKRTLEIIKSVMKKKVVKG